MQSLFVTIPQLSSVLSGGSVMKRVGLVIQLSYFLLTRKLLSIKNPVRFAFEYNGKHIPMFLRTTVDIAALKEIYLQNEYSWNIPGPVKVIVDLGAHIGDTTLFYHTQYPDAQIIALEPAPDSFAILQKNTSHIPNITAIQAAVGDTEGLVRLYITKSSLGNSISERNTTVDHVDVPQHTIKTVLSEAGVAKADLIKFDIEGAEEQLFASMDDPRRFSRSFIGEVHEDLMQATQDDIVDALQAYEVVIEPIKGKIRSIVKAVEK